MYVLFKTSMSVSGPKVTVLNVLNIEARGVCLLYIHYKIIFQKIGRFVFTIHRPALQSTLIFVCKQ